MLFYPAALPLSAQTLTYAAGIIRRHRKKIGSCWRKLTPGRQALLVLAYPRKGGTSTELAAGFGIGTAAAWRYVTETVALLLDQLREQLQGRRDAGENIDVHEHYSGVYLKVRYRRRQQNRRLIWRAGGRADLDSVRQRLEPPAGL